MLKTIGLKQFNQPGQIWLAEFLYPIPTKKPATSAYDRIRLSEHRKPIGKPKPGLLSFRKGGQKSHPGNP